MTVRYRLVISVIAATFRLESRPIVTHSPAERILRGLPYSLGSLLLGPWGVPWGPWLTVKALAQNLSGRAALGITAALLGFASPVSAGVYLAAEPTPFAVTGTPAGPVAAELPYSPRFLTLLSEYGTARQPQFPNNPARLRALARSKELLGRKLTAAEAVELAGHQLRLGDAAAALNRLEPLARRGDWLAGVTLAHAHAARGEYDLAFRAHQAAFESEPPAQLPGATPEQTRWLVKVERDYVGKWFRVRAQEPARETPDTLRNQGPPPLFGEVRFVGESGRYEPGRLAAAERAKLPPDAVAIVQQMLLWSPDETRLLWLLAELAAAGNELRTADQIIEQCVDGRAFTNRPVLMEHRAAVRAAVAALPPEKAPELPPDTPPAPTPTDVPPPPPDGWAELRPKVFAVAAGFGVLAAFLLALQARAWRRRRRG